MHCIRGSSLSLGRRVPLLYFDGVWEEWEGVSGHGHSFLLGKADLAN